MRKVNELEAYSSLASSLSDSVGVAQYMLKTFASSCAFRTQCGAFICDYCKMFTLCS
jgi:hypothetical protein